MFGSFATSVVLHIAYGHEILSDVDPYVQITADSSYAITHCGPPGGTLVDLFPIRRSLLSKVTIHQVHGSSHSSVPAILVPRNLLCVEGARVQSLRSTVA